MCIGVQRFLLIKQGGAYLHVCSTRNIFLSFNSLPVNKDV